MKVILISTQIQLQIVEGEREDKQSGQQRKGVKNRRKTNWLIKSIKVNNRKNCIFLRNKEVKFTKETIVLPNTVYGKKITLNTTL